MYHKPVAPPLPKPNRRWKSKGRQVLLASMPGVVPTVPEGGDIGMRDEESGLFQVSDDVFQTVAAGAEAELAWRASEDAKDRLAAVDDRRPTIKEKASAKYLEWMLTREAAFESLSPRDKDVADFCADLLYAVGSYADRVEDTTRKALPPITPTTTLQLPDHGSARLCDELRLAVACTVLGKCQPHLGRYSRIAATIHDTLVHCLYTTPVGTTWHSVTSRTEEYLNTVPFFRSSNLITWENDALTEELRRAKHHMFLWSWAIWRKVVKGKRRYYQMLTKTDILLKHRADRRLLLVVLRSWRQFVERAKEERYIAELGNMVSCCKWVPAIATLDDKLQCLVQRVEEQDGIIAEMQEKLEKKEKLIEQMSNDLITVAKKAGGHNSRALQAIARHTQAVDRITELEVVIEKMKDTEKSLRAQLDAQKAESDDNVFELQRFDTNHAEYLAGGHSNWH